MATSTMLQTSGLYEYYTPLAIIEAAWETMGGIDLDPASSEAANRTVRATRYYTEAIDGLTQDWAGRVWMNHPFGREQNPRWISKLMTEWDTLNIEAACCITYACTSEQWFQPLLQFAQCFLSPRTNYLLPDGTIKRGVQKGSVVTYLGDDRQGFRNAFASLGVVKV